MIVSQIPLGKHFSAILKVVPTLCCSGAQSLLQWSVLRQEWGQPEGLWAVECGEQLCSPFTPTHPSLGGCHMSPSLFDSSKCIA